MSETSSEVMHAIRPGRTFYDDDLIKHQHVKHLRERPLVVARDLVIVDQTGVLRRHVIHGSEVGLLQGRYDRVAGVHHRQQSAGGLPISQAPKRTSRWTMRSS